MMKNNGQITGLVNKPNRYLQKLLFLFFTLAYFASCDMLRFSPFEVSSWSPGTGRFDDPQAITLSLEFSHDPDRASVEKTFSVSEDGNKLKGIFQWEGRKVSFLPLAPLEMNRDYTLNLSADVHDLRGLSLDQAFEGFFTTRPDEVRPALISFFPGMYEVVSCPRQEIRLVFLGEAPIISLRDNISFSPAMNGSWDFNGSEAVFTPSEPWTHGKRYELRISEYLSGTNGMSMGRDFSSVFIIGQDNEKPNLSGAWRLTENGGLELLQEDIPGSFIENSGWEKTDRLLLSFSKPVDILLAKNCINVQGASVLGTLNANGFYDEVIFSFERIPAYESRFSVTVKPGIRDKSGNESENEYLFRVYANGPDSMPPTLVGVRIPMAPGNALDRETKSYATDDLFADLPINGGNDRYPYREETETWIECYFETAPGALIDQFSLMELFRVNTSNNVLSFSPRSIRSSNFSMPDTEPGWEGFQRIEIRGFLINTVNSGVVNIEIASGIRDSKNNINEKLFRISLLK
jgi:hypothetical protein